MGPGGRGGSRRGQGRQSLLLGWLVRRCWVPVQAEPVSPGRELPGEMEREGGSALSSEPRQGGREGWGGRQLGGGSGEGQALSGAPLVETGTGLPHPRLSSPPAASAESTLYFVAPGFRWHRVDFRPCHPPPCVSVHCLGSGTGHPWGGRCGRGQARVVPAPARGKAWAPDTGSCTNHAPRSSVCRAGAPFQPWGTR